MRSSRLTPCVALVGFIVAAVSGEGLAASYDLAVDVPTELGGVIVRKGEIARWEDGAYSIIASLPGSPAIGALNRRDDGGWELALREVGQLGGVDYLPNDLLLWYGSGYTPIFRGSSEGIPATSRIDAVFVDGGNYILSFDVPTTLGSTTYSPSDLVRRVGAGAFALYRSGQSAGIPLGSNVVAAMRSCSGDLVVSFDVPATVGGTTFVPGDAVVWGTTTLFLYGRDSGWPRGVQLSGVTGGGTETWYRDADGDGYGSPADKLVGCAQPSGWVSNGTDCNDSSGSAWAQPGEVRNLRLGADRETMDWWAPTFLGGSSMNYDTLRSNVGSSFLSSTTCVESNDGTDQRARDAARPSLGAAFFYLVRADNACPGDATLGYRSDGSPRAGRTCP